METRVCFNCHAEKDTEEFYKSSDKLYQNECKECTRVRRSKWWKSDKGKRSSANSKLKARFGITIDEYELLLEKAGNKCEICGATFSLNNGVKHRLSVDHDHKTGNIRGILCKSCNLVIGNAYDSIETLKTAIAYLTRFTENN